eukprot:CAMPEP_0119333962 /NCGR_PEP_ID=MMETSP1333-20130426/86357_1 /TAXON_ID=418940 /ORGANISM="Scyphosphaera apsteinii, Strain RCC1455" /LENGTH=43 /DNA_ID= /DNA_START= /DNA_END= /DNA_ORIENTATION=
MAIPNTHARDVRIGLSGKPAFERRHLNLGGQIRQSSCNGNVRL